MNTWNNIYMPLKEDRLWELYHENSKTSRHIRSGMDQEHDMQNTGLHISLPVTGIRDINLLSHEETNIDSGHQECTFGALSSILTNASEAMHAAGSHIAILSPLEVYIIVSSVTGLAAGLYHLDKEARVLRLVDDMVDRGRLSDCIPEHGSGSAHLCITALFERSALRFGEKGYRFAVSESGRMMQAVIHEAQARNLSASILYGYPERSVEDLLGIDGVDHALLQMIEFQ